MRLRRQNLLTGQIPAAPAAQPVEVDSRFAMEFVTTSGRAASLEFRVGKQTVEVWRRAHCGAVFNRDLLRSWLATPSELPLVVDEVEFSLDHSVDSDGRVAVTLPDVLAWTLAPTVLEALRGHV